MISSNEYRLETVEKALSKKQLKIFLTDDKGINVERIEHPTAMDVETLTNNGLSFLYLNKNGYHCIVNKTFILFNLI